VKKKHFFYIFSAYIRGIMKIIEILQEMCRNFGVAVFAATLPHSNLKILL